VNKTIRNLAEHLSANGVPITRIPACVRDLGFIVAEKPSVGPLELNAAMGRRGWKDFRGDDRTLLLILLLVAETLLESDAGKRLWFERHLQQYGRSPLRLVP
jgi:hypothetical protein